MGLLFSILLIILGALAVYPAVVQTWPATKQWLDKLIPYEGRGNFMSSKYASQPAMPTAAIPQIFVVSTASPQVVQRGWPTLVPLPISARDGSSTRPGPSPRHAPASQGAGAPRC